MTLEHNSVKVEVIFKAGKPNDKIILLPSQCTRSDDFDDDQDGETFIDKQHSGVSIREQGKTECQYWIYMIVVGAALLLSCVCVTIVFVVKNMQSDSTKNYPKKPDIYFNVTTLYPSSMDFAIAKPVALPSNPTVSPNQIDSIYSKPSAAPSFRATNSPSELPSLDPKPGTSSSLTTNPSSVDSENPTRTSSLSPTLISSTLDAQNSTGATQQPTFSPTQSPVTPFVTSYPANSPVVPPVGGREEYTTLLTADQRISRNQIFFSPNGQYSLFLSDDNGDLTLVDSTSAVVWSTAGEGGGAQTCHLQPDGNLLLKRSNGSSTWSSKTSGNPGASLRLNNAGQLILFKQSGDNGGTAVWLAGLPQFHNPTNISLLTAPTSLSFPIRGAFYYPWFPETWYVNNVHVKYTPRLGYYSNELADIQRAHIDMLTYARVDVAIASWWGPDSHLDRSRITNLLNKSRGKSLKWTVYHEMERDLNPTVQEIISDLEYLKDWFAGHENWAYIDGRPVVFLYNEDDCNVSERWMTAAGQAGWYVVLKKFSDHENCAVQPNGWHQYGPASAVAHAPGYSFAVSPGFWRADQTSPLLERISREEFCANVLSMVESNEPWQLVNTFNEWGEGTAVEPASEWASSSGYGYYLDCLHEVY